MARVKGSGNWQSSKGKMLTALAIVVALAVPAVQAQQSGADQTPPSAPSNSQPAQDIDIPDAPSTVQPPAVKPPPPAAPPADAGKKAEPIPFPGDVVKPRDQENQATPSASSSSPENVPAGTVPRNQINPQEDLYKLVVPVNFVQIPVMVKDSDGRRVDGLLAKDFTVLENGKTQTLTFFTSDPFQLSVAVLLDIGMPDVAVQKVNQTYASLVGAFSPYDEVAIYTYSSTVSQVTDFTGRAEKLTAVLNQMKLVRGHNNGPPVMSGPLASGPTINGAPAGGPTIQPVNTPPRESHVLNDAILRAALDLGKRERSRRKVIFVISDGRELGSKASYSDVLHVLETQGIQVKAVVVEGGALPVFRQVGKLHLPGQGYSDILPKYSSATGGGQVFTELTRNAMERAYAQVTSEARNQYTLGYVPKAVSVSTKREIEILVAKKGLKIYAKDGYYPISSTR
jgi:VWFA-related protein